MGTILINVGGQAGEERFAHLPNFVGDNLSDGQLAGIDDRFVGGKSRVSRVEIKVAAAGVSDGSRALCLDSNCQPYSTIQDQYSFEVQAPNRLYLMAQDDVAYLVLDSIRWN